MASANSTRARGIQIEDHCWGRFSKGTREMLVKHGYATDVAFPGDPGVKKYSIQTTDPDGREIKIRRASKYLFVVLRDWNEDEAKAYDAKVSSANMAKTKGHKETMEWLERFYSLPIEEQTAILVKRGSDPQLIANNILRSEELLARTNKPIRCGKVANTPELTRLHRLTNEEADLILDYRLLGEQAKQATRHLVKSQAEGYVDQTGGNVVGIRRTAG